MDQSDNTSRSRRWQLLRALFIFIHLYIYIIFLWLHARSRRDELFAPHENCGKSIFHFLLGPSLHLCCNYRRDSSHSSKAFKKQAASRPSWLINLGRMTSGSSPLKASASRDTSVPVLLTRLVFRCRFGLESSGWATVSRKKKINWNSCRSGWNGLWKASHGCVFIPRRSRGDKSGGGLALEVAARTPPTHQGGFFSSFFRKVLKRQPSPKKNCFAGFKESRILQLSTLCNSTNLILK